MRALGLSTYDLSVTLLAPVSVAMSHCFQLIEHLLLVFQILRAADFLLGMKLEI